MTLDFFLTTVREDDNSTQSGGVPQPRPPTDAQGVFTISEASAPGWTSLIRWLPARPNGQESCFSLHALNYETPPPNHGRTPAQPSTRHDGKSMLSLEIFSLRPLPSSDTSAKSWNGFRILLNNPLAERGAASLSCPSQSTRVVHRRPSTHYDDWSASLRSSSEPLYPVHCSPLIMTSFNESCHAFQISVSIPPVKEVFP